VHFVQGALSFETLSGKNTTENILNAECMLKHRPQLSYSELLSKTKQYKRLSVHRTVVEC